MIDSCSRSHVWWIRFIIVVNYYDAIYLLVLASRHVHGIREDVDERAFFPEASGSARSYTDSYQQLSMSSYKSYSNSNFQNINDATNPRQQEQQHCFVLGTDFKSTRPIKEKEAETTSQRPLHRFFGEWPPKNTDSWLDLASNSRIPTGNNDHALPYSHNHTPFNIPLHAYL